ncbi:MAG: hypothetical protein CW338_01775, partial [Clostridiales bacterium]|nr:hypothetical protein [Clostridiales bacterium]
MNDACGLTDDTVMTLAVADAILNCHGHMKKLPDETIACMQKLGRRYPDAGYGGSFFGWIYAPAPVPYNSWGNGSAMRVSPCGWAADTLDRALKLAECTAKVTHNHPEGIRGAKATAAAVYLARTGKSIDEIRRYINENFYRLDFTIDEIRDDYEFDVSCQGSVPQAIEAFLESVSFEDAIRTAVSVGGDSDTIAAITGGIAEAYYGIPDSIRELALTYLDEFQLDILDSFEAVFGIEPGKRD